jgi:Dolichyl-phosphate-mannose-protein mannosyltransferase
MNRLRELLRRRADRFIALALAVATSAWLLAVEGRQGIGRDEAQYFRAAERSWTWFESVALNLKAGRFTASFSGRGITDYWGDNREHPVVMKILYGLSWRAFHRCECVKERAQHLVPVLGSHVTLPLFARESTAFRFPAILMAGLGAALVFFFARQFVGRMPAVVASVLSVAQPHYFFHAQISAFDAPITVMAVAVGYCYWRSLRPGRTPGGRPRLGWLIAAGVVFGIALGVKHNAWLMPIFLAGHYAWLRRRDLFSRKRRFPPLPGALLAMAVLGPLVFWLHWPLLWVNPISHTRWYVQRHVQHEHYNFEYLGRNWNNPPKELDRRLLRTTFPFVSTGLTVPVTTLALAAVGAVLLVRRRRDEDAPGAAVDPAAASRILAPDAPAEPERATWQAPAADVDRAPGTFFFVQILGPMAVIALPDTPIFGGVKHFMPAMPYLAMVAGIGAAWLFATFGRAVSPRPRVAQLAPAALATLVCLPAVFETRRSHPDGLSHYNLIAGGFSGGASLGMNRQFWGYSVLPMLDWFAAHVPPSRATYWHDVFPEAVPYYVRDGRIPPGLGDVGVGEDRVRLSDIGLLIYERHFAVYEGLLWEAYGTTKPAYVRTREGVPLVAAYLRPGLK